MSTLNIPKDSSFSHSKFWEKIKKLKIINCSICKSNIICAKLGNHSQEDLAELGYQPGMKVNFQKNPSHFGLNARTQ
jgi:hypothetical protein